VTVFCLVSSSYGQTVNCGTLSGSCAQCMAATNCSYYWGNVAYFNSSLGGVCTSTSNLMYLMYNNQYSKSVYAYALPDASLNTTLGQYKLQYTDTSLNYGAVAVPCYDRQLCYCKPMPPPPPSTLIVVVTNCATSLNISGASVLLSGNSSTVTDSTGEAVYYPIPPGTYVPSVTASGFLANSAPAVTISVNQTITVSICLTPIPCLLTVNTTIAVTGAPLATVSINLIGTIITGTSSAQGLVTFNLSAGSSGTVNGSITGYTSNPASFSCGSGGGGTPVVPLIFTPIPNTVIVTVRDSLDGSLITGATIGLTGFTSQTGDNNAQASFGGVAAGSGYVASASKLGYTSNTTAVPTLTFGQTVNVIVFLTDLPCSITVTVMDNLTLTPVAGALVTANTATLPSPTNLTNSLGVTTFVLPWNASQSASASAVGYANGSASYLPICGRGVTVTVTIYLNEVIIVYLSAKDAQSPGQPPLPFANIYWDGVLVTQVNPLVTYQRVLQLPTLPVTGYVNATAAGYNNQSHYPVTFNTTVRSYVISMSPQEFTLYFVPVEVYPDGTTGLLPAGVLNNNYAPPVSLKYVYTPATITVVGQITDIGDNSVVSGYVVSTWNSTDPTYLGPQPITYYAAVFTKIEPTSQSHFDINPNASLDNYLANPNSTIAPLTKELIFVPDYSATQERHLVYFLPYVLNAGFITVRVFPLQSDKRTRAFFGSTDFLTCTLNTRSSNYNGVGKGISLLVYDFNVGFNTQVNNITFVYDTTTYDQANSNWLALQGANQETLTGNYSVLPLGQGSQYAAFNWPTADIVANFVLLTNGQIARDPASNLYLLRDFGLVYLPGQNQQK
jgi:hypothetical protein